MVFSAFPCVVVSSPITCFLAAFLRPDTSVSTCHVAAEHSSVCWRVRAVVSVLWAPLHPDSCERQSKKRASPHLTAGTAEELACLINSPLIWNLLTEQKLLHKSSHNLHSSLLSLITTDLTSSARANQPPTVLPVRRLSITTTY